MILKMKTRKHMAMFLRSSLMTGVLIPVFIIILGPLYGQNNHNEQVTIVGTYDPSINQSYKINTQPTVQDFSFQNKGFVFEPLNIRQSTKISLQPIIPSAIRADSKTPVFNNYLKAGFGSWISPLLDFYHGNNKKGSHSFNLRIFHFSAFKNIPDYSPSPFSNTLANIGYQTYAGKTVIALGAKYEMNTNRYYGFNPESYTGFNISEDSLKQVFNLAKINLGFKSNNKREGKLEYNINLSSYYYFDRYKSNETDVKLDYNLAKPFDVTRKLNYQKLGIEGTMEYSINNDSTDRFSNLLATVIPYFKAKYGIISFKAGLNFTYLNRDKGHFYFYPILDVNVTFSKDMLTVYAGIDGGVIKNSFLELTTQNPWATSVVPVEWQNNKFNVYGGLRGNIARSFGFNLKAGWLKFKNMPFFVNISDFPWGPPYGPLNKFTAVFDDGSVFTFSGELTYNLKSNLKLWLSGEYNSYSLDSLPQPYHKPLTKIVFGGSYLIAKKVEVKAEALYYGKRFAVNNQPLVPWEITLDSFVDINLGVTYYITKNLSVFLSGNNLLNWNYERYYNYPVQGLQIMGGVGYRF